MLKHCCHTGCCNFFVGLGGLCPLHAELFLKEQRKEARRSERITKERTRESRLRRKVLTEWKEGID